MLALIVGAAVVALSGAILVARRSAQRRARESVARLPLGSNGVIVGADTIELRHGGDQPAVLMLHGAGDTPQTLRYLATHLHANGYDVRAPLLPGHGRTTADFAHVTADQWMDAARANYRDLCAQSSWVAIVGLSMGGALAVRLAAETPALPALALLAPYLAMPRGIALAASLAPAWEFAVPYVRALDPSARRSIHDPAENARSLAYGVFTPAALRALHTTVVLALNALPRVSAPTLMVQSKEDNRIPPAAAQGAFDRIGAGEKRLVWIEGAGHVITVDYGRERVFDMVTNWLDNARAARTRSRGRLQA